MTTSSEREGRLRFLIRRNYGRLMRPQLRSEVSEVIGREFSEVAFIDLEQSERIIADWPSCDARWDKSWRENEVSHVRDFMQRLAQHLPDQSVCALFIRECGLLQLQLTETLTNAIELVRLRDFCVAVPNGKCRLQFGHGERPPDDFEDRYVTEYYIMIWGCDWITAAEESITAGDNQR